MAFEKLEALRVVLVIGVDVGVERTRVDDKGYLDTSERKISSMRTEMSCEPLRPALAASSFRLPFAVPRWASMASRVRSEIVMPRRSASCRSLASRSSVSFTVVRLMVCQHTAGGTGTTCPLSDPNPRTNTKTSTRPPSSRSLCPTRWSTRWGQAHRAEGVDRLSNPPEEFGRLPEWPIRAASPETGSSQLAGVLAPDCKVGTSRNRRCFRGTCPYIGSGCLLTYRCMNIQRCPSRSSALYRSPGESLSGADRICAPLSSARR